MTKISPRRIDSEILEIRNRLQNATPGPWVTAEEMKPRTAYELIASCGVSGTDDRVLVPVMNTKTEIGNPVATAHANADFLAHSYEDIQFLLSLLEEVEPEAGKGVGAKDGKLNMKLNTKDGWKIDFDLMTEEDFDEQGIEISMQQEIATNEVTINHLESEIKRLESEKSVLTEQVTSLLDELRTTKETLAAVTDSTTGFSEQIERLEEEKQDLRSALLAFTKAYANTSGNDKDEYEVEMFRVFLATCKILKVIAGSPRITLENTIE